MIKAHRIDSYKNIYFSLSFFKNFLTSLKVFFRFDQINLFSLHVLKLKYIE